MTNAPSIDDVLAEKRRRLGTALQRLAKELAEARRRNKQLERELDRLRRAAGKESRPG